MDFLQKKTKRDTEHVLLLGDVMLDQYIAGHVSRISPEAPVPVVCEESVHATPGGAANVAANLAALGANVRLLGVCGADREGHQLREILETLSFPENTYTAGQQAQGAGKIDVSGLLMWEGRPTTLKMRLLSQNQQIVRLDREKTGAFPEFLCQRLIQVAEESMAWADVVVFSDYRKGTLEGGVFEKIAEIAAQAGKKILVDPKQKDLSFYKGASLLTPNKAELGRATDLPLASEEDIARALVLAQRQSGAEILLTRSDEGMSLKKYSGEICHFPARRVEVSDVSGAGDTVLAVMAVMLARGVALEESVKIAIEAASLAVSRHGTVQITREALKAHLQKNTAMLGRQRKAEFAPIFKDAAEAGHYCASLKKEGKKLIFTNGCFDILHPGHLKLLQKASSLGDRLVVGLNTDASVKRLKGASRPLQSEHVRALTLAGLRWVDAVVLFEEETPFEILQEIGPDIIVKGGDYQKEQVVGADMAEIFLFPLEEGYSTTSFYQHMLARHENERKGSADGKA